MIKKIGLNRYLIDTVSENMVCNQCLNNISQTSQVYGKTFALTKHALTPGARKHKNSHFKIFYCLSCFITKGNLNKGIDVKKAISRFAGGITA